MPTIDAHDPGTICWIDLASTDAAGATAILLRPVRLDGDRAGRERGRLPDAAARRPPGRPGSRRCGATPTARSWSTYVASADADQTCAAAIASGGEVVMDVMDVLDAGRMAVLRDPAGAQVSVWQPGEHQGYEVHGEPGAPIWSELMTRDIATARSFYGSVFGWTSQQQEFDGVSYTVWKHRDRLVGGALRDGRDVARRRAATLDGLHRDGRLRCDGAPLPRARRHRVASRRRTSAPVAARCSKIPRVARSRSSSCASRRNAM